MQCSKEIIVRLFYNTSSSFQLLFLFFYLTSIFLSKLLFFISSIPFLTRNDDEYEYATFSEEEQEQEEEEEDNEVISNRYYYDESTTKDDLLAHINIEGQEDLFVLQTSLRSSRQNCVVFDEEIVHNYLESPKEKEEEVGDISVVSSEDMDFYSLSKSEYEEDSNQQINNRHQGKEEDDEISMGLSSKSFRYEVNTPAITTRARSACTSFRYVGDDPSLRVTKKIAFVLDDDKMEANELETATFTSFPEVLPIGHMLASNTLSKQIGHFWTEDATCLTWLDQQPARSHVRSSLLTRDPLLEVKDAYNVVYREESHRGVPESSSVTESKQNATSLCFEIVGFPQGIKRNSNTGKQTFNANADIKMNDKSSSPSLSSGFPLEMMQKLLSMINDKSSGSIHANMTIAGNSVSKHLRRRYAISSLMDTAYSHPNGTLATISHVGNLKLTNNVVLYALLVVPGFCVSLLSINKFIRDSKMFVGFDENKCKSNVVLSFHVSKLLWHNRLGHPVDQVLYVLKKGMDISNNTSVPMCEAAFICIKCPGHSRPTQNNDEVQTPMLRRSDRQSKRPFRLNDYVLNSKVMYGIKKYVSYSKLNSVNLCFATNMNKYVKTSCVYKDLYDPNWVEAINNEIEDLHRNNTLTVYDLPFGRKPIEFRLDVNNAFLYGDLVEDVYITLPGGYNNEDNSKHNGDKFVALLVYIADIVITGNDDVGIKEFKLFLSTKFLIIDLGVSKYFLGIEDIENDLGPCKSPVSWKSKKQATIYKSSSEAEYRNCSPVFHERTKHFELDVYFIIEKVLAGNIKTVKIFLLESLLVKIEGGRSIIQGKERIKLISLKEDVKCESLWLKILQGPIVNEGFLDLNIHHVGGYWIWIQFPSSMSCSKFQENESLKRLYSVKRAPMPNFKIDERILWIEVSGLPLCAWGSMAYKKIASSFGKFLFFEKEESTTLSSGRLCISTKSHQLISETVHVDIKNEYFEVSVQEIGS
ncbi:ribonuclease H-like domain-containing protein [Tanacetum coccineum]|uniref:Ribonuclease H-like domain-containing protein n=1 Tax=Tanacetum coccineum TaxID=301880 RepID=A0ABQ5D3G7_9ASTR